MSETLTLQAEKRDRGGKGASRAVRREGFVPAVIYGEKKEPVSIKVERRALVKLLQRGTFMNSMVNVEVNGSAERCLPRDVQFDPATDVPLHVDFLRVGKGARIAVNVPVHFRDEEKSPGIKRGGVLNIVRHEVELECPADSIPDEVVASLDGLEVNDSIHISAVTLPKGVVPVISDRDFTIATIVAPSGLRSREDAAAEASEGEAEDEGEDKEA